jgi:hypothetical protein
LLTIVCSTLVGVVHIKVTESSAEKDFYISKDLLLQRAPDLAESIQKNHQYETVIKINDTSIETFSIFTEWLNLGPDDYLFFALEKLTPFCGYPWSSAIPLIKLYIFACDYGILQLANDAICRFTSIVNLTGDKIPLSPLSELKVHMPLTVAEIQYVYKKAICAANKNLNYTLMKCDPEFMMGVIMFIGAEKKALEIRLAFCGCRA